MAREYFSCTNCEYSFEGDFCPACGQRKFSKNQFAFPAALKEMAGECFDMESTLVKTLRRLLFAPGQLTTDHLSGKQRAYVGPVRLYLVVITLNFLVYSFLEEYSLINVEFLKSLVANIGFFQERIDVPLQRSGLSAAGFYHQVNQRVNEILPILLYLLIFVQALVLKIQFFGAHWYYMEHLVFAVHFMSFGFLRDVLFLPIQWIDPRAGFILTILSTVLYLFLAIRRCYIRNFFKAVVHTLVHYVAFFFFFFVTIISAVLVALREF